MPRARTPRWTPTPATGWTLDTQRPGRYVLQATGSTGGVKTNDTVTVDAVLAPMLALDTLASASGGGPGIKLGSTVYPVYAPLPQAQWQVIILDRHTGAVKPGYNYTYGVCPDNAQATCRWNSDGKVAKSPQQDLADMGTTQMAIAVHHHGIRRRFRQRRDLLRRHRRPEGLQPQRPDVADRLAGLGAG